MYFVNDPFDREILIWTFKSGFGDFLSQHGSTNRLQNCTSKSLWASDFDARNPSLEIRGFH